MAFNPNVSNKKQIQDSPFLTLSQRNKMGISSQNIFGDKKTEGAQNSNEISPNSIFAGKTNIGLDDNFILGQQEEQSADQYLQENENGDVNFDEAGFYDDAWGINLSSNRQASTNPIKAGSANTGDKAAQETTKDELKTAFENGADENEISSLKDKAKEAGVEDNDIENLEQTYHSEAKAGSSATNPSVTDVNKDLKSSGITDMAKAITDGTYTCKATKKSNSGNSSSTGGSSFMADLGKTFVSGAVSNVGGQVAGSVTKPITQPIEQGMSKVADSISNALGLGKNNKSQDLDSSDAGNAKDVDTASKNVQTGQQAGTDAKADATDARTTGTAAQSGAREAGAAEASANSQKATMEASAAEQTQEAELQNQESEIQNATAETKAQIKAEKHAMAGKLTTEISQLEGEISQLSSSTNVEDKAQLAEKQAELAEKQAELAKCKEEEAAATADEVEAKQLSAEAKAAAGKAETAAEQAKNSAQEAQKLATTSRANLGKYTKALSQSQKALTTAQNVQQKATVFTKAAEQRLADIQKSIQNEGVNDVLASLDEGGRDTYTANTNSKPFGRRS